MAKLVRKPPRKIILFYTYWTGDIVGHGNFIGFTSNNKHISNSTFHSYEQTLRKDSGWDRVVITDIFRP